MLTIRKKQDETTLNVSLAGKMDAVAAPDFEEEVAKQLDGVSNLVIDMRDLDYLSSAGLRVLVLCARNLGHDGSIVIRNANDEIREIFDLTGLDNTLDIE